jgi:hypothetical protein
MSTFLTKKLNWRTSLAILISLGRVLTNMHSIVGDIHADNFAGAVRVLDSILGSVLAKFFSSVPPPNLDSGNFWFSRVGRNG